MDCILGKWCFFKDKLWENLNYHSSVRYPVLFYFNFVFNYPNQSGIPVGKCFSRPAKMTDRSVTACTKGNLGNRFSLLPEIPFMLTSLLWYNVIHVLSGERLKGYDVKHAGVATHFVTSEKVFTNQLLSKWEI